MSKQRFKELISSVSWSPCEAFFVSFIILKSAMVVIQRASSLADFQSASESSSYIANFLCIMGFLNPLEDKKQQRKKKQAYNQHTAAIAGFICIGMLAALLA
ncbi:hypothetical protein [Microbulbifer sp. 2205BS26-8]|uniref:hypothetical protein n=1 Tax=Microbulbifer sp. 2205BS26-8 TaxID=3064386 RepID=UPI00273EB117|nr:hypothetical protein [Microbulbifer sp. 2205BS26-8]MDP5210915.1 hypothetical protein [Microbulbifer sp. 2205BS26-8]